MVIGLVQGAVDEVARGAHAAGKTTPAAAGSNPELCPFIPAQTTGGKR